jgi:hypothetical protein
MATGAGMAWWNAWEPGAATSGAVDSHGSWPLRAHLVQPCTTAVLALAFDEGEGSETADAAGGGCAVLGGPWADDFAEPAWTEGVSGHALRFDGKRQFVSVATGAAFDLPGSMTMECWFRNWPRMEKQAMISGSNFYLHLQYNGEPKFSWDEVRGKNHTVEVEQAIVDTLWHHLAYVYDSVRGESRLYLDGHLGEAAPDSERVVDNPGSLFIGARMKDRVVSDLFEGCIDQVQITAAARYSDDFEPQRQFDVTGPSITFLQWTPRSHQHAETYDIFCQVGARLERMNATPLRSTCFYDTSTPTGPRQYELGTFKHGVPTARTRLDWSPPGPTAVSR